MLAGENYFLITANQGGRGKGRQLHVDIWLDSNVLYSALFQYMYICSLNAVGWKDLAKPSSHSALRMKRLLTITRFISSCATE